MMKGACAWVIYSVKTDELTRVSVRVEKALSMLYTKLHSQRADYDLTNAGPKAGFLIWTPKMKSYRC
jgi:hypothetical protein